MLPLLPKYQRATVYKVCVPILSLRCHTLPRGADGLRRERRALVDDEGEIPPPTLLSPVSQLPELCSPLTLSGAANDVELISRKGLAPAAPFVKNSFLVRGGPPHYRDEEEEELFYIISHRLCMHKTFANEPITTADVHYKLRGITSSSLMNGRSSKSILYNMQQQRHFGINRFPSGLKADLNTNRHYTS